jgi:two-component system, chemotaxis family, CheB/CheR fusion protein
MSAEEERQVENADLRSLLEYLKAARGFDFTGYKPPSLERRIRKRMGEVGVESYGDYQDYLEVTPDEFTDLFNAILINVTGFFRDKPAWDYLASDIVPKLLEEVPDPLPLRVWSAGCASGEEAYTVGMLLAEAIGEEDFKRRVKIFATDVDEEALAQGRQATYPRDALKSLPEDLAGRYFEDNPLGGVFRPDLRRSIIFGRNDLVQDAPISRIDLLVSRNTLMYFIPEAQGQILRHFNFALKEAGFLFLGKSEMLVTHSDLFTPYSMEWRVFRKVPRIGLRERLTFVTEAAAPEAQPELRHPELQVGALEMAPDAVLIVDSTGHVAAVNRQARALFGLAPADLGRPLRDLDASYRPVDLRSAIDQAIQERRPVSFDRVTWEGGGDDPRTLEVSVTPMVGDGDVVLGTVVLFVDVTDHARLNAEHDRSQRQLETAYEELQSTVEELETTNEELHSTNEELETTNEELQSSNEELETMNEELQSTNAELETLSREQGIRSEELDRVNLFLEGILGNLGVGVIVVDRDQLVQVWNASSTDLWGLRPEEVEGKALLALDINLPLDELREPLKKALGNEGGVTETTVDAVNRRGQSFSCWMKVMPLRSAEGETSGAILLMADREVSGAPVV